MHQLLKDSPGEKMLMLGNEAIAGEPVRMSEFHGMAQRGGVVESMILLGHGESVCISDGELIVNTISRRLVNR